MLPFIESLAVTSATERQTREKQSFGAIGAIVVRKQAREERRDEGQAAHQSPEAESVLGRTTSPVTHSLDPRELHPPSPIQAYLYRSPARAAGALRCAWFTPAHTHRCGMNEGEIEARAASPVRISAPRLSKRIMSAEKDNVR